MKRDLSFLPEMCSDDISDWVSQPMKLIPWPTTGGALENAGPWSRPPIGGQGLNLRGPGDVAAETHPWRGPPDFSSREVAGGKLHKEFSSSACVTLTRGETFLSTMGKDGEWLPTPTWTFQSGFPMAARVGFLKNSFRFTEKWWQEFPHTPHAVSLL